MRQPVVLWDEDKAEANRIRHGVEFSEAVDVLRDPLAITVEDDVHSTPGEHRVTIVGMSRRGRLLRVTVEERGTILRVITAWRPTAQERRDYEEG